MILTTDLLVNRISFNSLFLKKLVAYYMTEFIICSIVIKYNSTQLLYNPVVLKYWKESILLLVFIMRGYRTKAKKSIYKLFLAINKIAINYKKKMIIWRGPDINREVNTC